MSHSQPEDAVLKLHHESAGRGTRIIGATGWTVPTPRDFTDALPRALSTRRITSFHYRDTGKSPASQGMRHSAQIYARDLLAVIDAEAVERPHLIGIGGMGAIVMMELAAMIPDRVGSLVLHQGWARCDIMLRWQIEAMQHLLRDSGFPAYQRLAAALCYTPDYLEKHEATILGTGWTAIRAHKEAHLAFMSSSLAHDARERLGRITAPTLLITGDATDCITGDRLLGELKQGIRHAEVHVMKGVPHSFRQSPAFVAEFDDRIGDFWSRHGA